MSFRQYVARRRIADNPQGDFVTDARQDPTLPDAKSWAELRRYLRDRDAYLGAITAAHSVWRDYQAKQRWEETKDPRRWRITTAKPRGYYALCLRLDGLTYKEIAAELAERYQAKPVSVGRIRQVIQNVERLLLHPSRRDHPLAVVVKARREQRRAPNRKL